MSQRSPWATPFSVAIIMLSLIGGAIAIAAVLQPQTKVITRWHATHNIVHTIVEPNPNDAAPGTMSEREWGSIRIGEDMDTVIEMFGNPPGNKVHDGKEWYPAASGGTYLITVNSDVGANSVKTKTYYPARAAITSGQVK